MVKINSGIKSFFENYGDLFWISFWVIAFIFVLNILFERISTPVLKETPEFVANEVVSKQKYELEKLDKVIKYLKKQDDSFLTVSQIQEWSASSRERAAFTGFFLKHEGVFSLIEEATKKWTEDVVLKKMTIAKLLKEKEREISPLVVKELRKWNQDSYMTVLDIQSVLIQKNKDTPFWLAWGLKFGRLADDHDSIFGVPTFREERQRLRRLPLEVLESGDNTLGVSSVNPSIAS